MALAEMTDDEPSLELVERLASSADLRDRAFAASILDLRVRTEPRERLTFVHDRIRETAAAEHAEIRSRIRDGSLDRAAFVTRLREAPLETRDHLVEEILGIAYPPLPDASFRETDPHLPSGTPEILFMTEHADLHRGKTFVDLGSGLGKVVLLTALLTGAESHGIELDPGLVAHATEAARELGLRNAHFTQGDIRDAPLPPADVYYMYIPVARSTDVAARLAGVTTGRKARLFAPSLELTRLPWLEATGAASYWLNVYERR